VSQNCDSASNKSLVSAIEVQTPQLSVQRRAADPEVLCEPSHVEALACDPAATREPQRVDRVKIELLSPTRAPNNAQAPVKS